MPRHRKIARISDGPRANANPTAVPTNGAEQGVVTKVANTPARKASSMGPLVRWPQGSLSNLASRSEAIQRSSLEQDRQHRHSRQEPGLLKLYAPAEGCARQF